MADQILELFDKPVKSYADARDGLAEELKAMEDEIEAVKREHLKSVKKKFRKMADAKTELREAVEAHPERFAKPKTHQLHGVQFGYRKKAGTVEISNDAKTVELIKKHFPDKADVLIQVTEKPMKKPLATLPASELKKLAVEVKADSDVVVIKATDSAIDKIIGAMEKEIDKMADEEAA